MDSSNKPDNGNQSEPALVGLLARVIASFVRVFRWLKEKLRRLTGKKRGRYAPLVDMPSAKAITPRIANPAAKSAVAVEQVVRTPLLSIPHEEEDQPEFQSITHDPGLAKPAPLKKTVEFQASEVTAETDHDMIARIQARKTSSRGARHLRAQVWIGQRKLARLHRRFPLWLVAAFYLLCAGILSVLLSLPFLSAPKDIATRTHQKTSIKAEDPKHLLEDIAQLISLKKYDEAQKELETLRTLWPDDVRVYQVEGALLAGRKDYVGARKAFEKALERQPQAKSVLFNLAEVDFVAGNYAAAEAGYKGLTGVWPKNGMILFRLYLCDRLQKHEADAAEIEKSPGLAPESVEWLYVQAAKNIFDDKKPLGLQYVEKARLLYPEEGKVCELTLQRLGLIK